MSKTPAEASRAPITADEVARIVGDVGDATAAAILATGATVEELEEAVAWAAGESDVMGEMERALSGPAARIYDILTADREFGEERE